MAEPCLRHEAEPCLRHEVRGGTKHRGDLAALHPSPLPAKGGERESLKQAAGGRQLRLALGPRANRHRAHQLLARLDDDHPGKARPQPGADALEHGCPAHQPLPVDGRHVERAGPLQWGEQRIGEQALELSAAVRTTVAERRGIEARPGPAPVGHDQQQPALRRKHAPYFAQHRACAIRDLQAVHAQQVIDGGVGQRQHGLVDQNREHVAGGRPYQRALARRHQGAEPRRLAAEHADVGHRKAESHQRAPLRAAPAGADALGQHAPHDAAQRAVVEVAKFENVELHETDGDVRGAVARLNSRNRLLGCGSSPKMQAKARE